MPEQNHTYEYATIFVCIGIMVLACLEIFPWWSVLVAAGILFLLDVVTKASETAMAQYIATEHIAENLMDHKPEATEDGFDDDLLDNLRSSLVRLGRDIENKEKKS